MISRSQGTTTTFSCLKNPFFPERPILFSGPMVRAILEGRKTQTRRVITKPICFGVNDIPLKLNGGLGPLVCRYGKPGDHLWVRETWAPHDRCAALDQDRSMIYYRADDETITGIRVQRVQEISEKDAKAEGVRVRDVLYPDEPYSAYSYVEQFKLLWDSINAKRGYGWNENPWAWVISFRREEGVSKGQGTAGSVPLRHQK